MRFFIFLFFIILFIEVTTAIRFSPSNLVFEVEEGQEACQRIFLDSESENVTISDKWKENKDIAWKIGLFEKKASDHSINIQYSEIVDEKEIEVCLSGDKRGEYHGVILLAPEKDENSVIQAGIWLKAVIGGGDSGDDGDEDGGDTSGGSSSGGGSKRVSLVDVDNKGDEEGGIQIQDLGAEIEPSEEGLEGEENKQDNENLAGVTGATIGTSDDKGWGIIIAVLVIIAIVGFIIYKKD